MKEDILKAILETDEVEVSRILKEAQLEGEAAEVLEGAAKLLKAYKDELPDDALQILAKACGLPEPEVEENNDPKKEGDGEGREGDPVKGLSKEAIAKMDPATQAVIKQLLEENTATKAEAKEARQPLHLYCRRGNEALMRLTSRILFLRSPIDPVLDCPKSKD